MKSIPELIHEMIDNFIFVGDSVEDIAEAVNCVLSHHKYNTKKINIDKLILSVYDDNSVGIIEREILKGKIK